MTNTELDGVADLILKEFIDNVGTGHLAMNTQGTWTDIGTFVDTIRTEAVGTHPASGAVTSTNYVFRQNLTAVTPNPSVRPLRIKYDGATFKGTQDMSNAEIVTNVINRCKSKLAGFSIGSYKLQPSSPAGGSWSAVATITNTRRDAAAETSTLWKRIDTPSATITNPIKHTSSLTIKEMTNAEVIGLTDSLRSEIVASGIGKYELSANSPAGGGSWQQCGSGFSDTRKVVSNVTYSAGYTGTYNRNWAGVYTGSYNRTYTGTYSGGYVHAYAGTYNRTYTGSYSGGYVHSWAGTYNRTYTGTYAGGYVRYYAGTNYGTYTGYYAGGYVHSWAGTYNRTYTGVYSGGYVHSWAGSYNRTWTGVYTGNYVHSWAGSYSGYYANTYAGTYTGNYVGATVQSALETANTLKLWMRVT